MRQDGEIHQAEILAILVHVPMQFSIYEVLDRYIKDGN